jgi:hypothetical protein
MQSKLYKNAGRGYDPSRLPQREDVARAVLFAVTADKTARNHRSAPYVQASSLTSLRHSEAGGSRTLAITVRVLRREVCFSW